MKQPTSGSSALSSYRRRSDTAVHRFTSERPVTSAYDSASATAKN
ncbi:hypothetical protein ACFWAN_18100 [Streptomyces mirabilis]